MNCRLLLAIAAAIFLAGCSSPAAQPTVSREVREEDVVVAPPPANPDTPLAITYQDLDLPMEPDAVFHDWLLTQRVRDLDGKRVRITGFMFSGSVYTTRNIKRFVMLRENEKDCPFGPGGQAHHAMLVSLREAAASFTTQPVTVERTLSVQPFAAENGNALYVYVLEVASLR